MVKRKSTSQNPFRYVSFTEQMANVNADVTRWKMALPTTTGDRETFFHDALEKCKDMDYGSYFKTFLEDLPIANHELRTYAQLLYHQKSVFNAILKHLSISESTSIATILELAIAFSRDLREDLKPYLWDLFNTIIEVIEKSGQQAEVLQTAFRALAILFKLQWRHIVKELRRTFMRFHRLFSSKKGYIRRFAAESFAFLLRKSSSITKIVLFLSETAEQDDTGTLSDGVSQLYFNAVKGVMRQFHSCAPQVLSEIIDASLNIPSSSTCKVAISILEGMMSRCVSYTKKEYASVLLDVLLQKFVTNSRTSSTREKAVAVSRLLLVWVTAKKGEAIIAPAALIKNLQESVAVDDWIPQANLLKLISETISRFHSLQDMHSPIVRIVDLIAEKTESINAALVYDFFSELMELPMFDLFLMPAVGKLSAKMLQCSDDELTEKVLEFYAFLCANRRPINDLKENRICFFDVSQHITVRDRIVQLLRERSVVSEKDVLLLSYASCSFPWLWRKAEEVKGMEMLKALFHQSLELKYSSCSHLALLCANAIALLEKILFSEIRLDELLSFLRRDSHHENALRVVYMVLPCTEDFETISHLTQALRIGNELLPFFGHWKSSVRQSALKIFSLFDLPLFTVEDEELKEKQVETNKDEESAFKMLLEAERTPLSLECYRDRIMLLRRLSCGAHKKHMPKDLDSTLETIPLRVIIAQLYENFSILWPHIFEIIENYGQGLDIDIFWPIYYSFLDDAVSKIVTPAKRDQKRAVKLDSLCVVLTDFEPDYVMFRLQMFKVLARISHVAERRSKVLSPMLISLFRKEYEDIDLQSRSRQDITQARESDSDNYSEHEIVPEEEIPSDAEQSDEEDHEAAPPAKRRKVAKRTKRRTEAIEEGTSNSTRRMVKRAIVALLETFGNFKSPKSIYMKDEIRLLYDELLLIGDSDIQKAVMKCIFAYKYKYLGPYRENFENLISEKTFLNELVRFGVDAQNSSIADEHRNEVIPILMRLLYGKLQTHVSKDKVSRRAAIFRFLAGCKPSELDVFLSVLFAPLLDVSSTPGSQADSERTLSAMCDHLSKAFTPSSMIPLVRLKGSLNGLAHVIKKLSPSLGDDQQALLYRLCVAAAVTTHLALKNVATIHPKYVKPLKTLRSLACTRFKELFFAFQWRRFSTDEINALFEYFIGPTCDTVSTGDKLVAPLNLVRLFASWTKVPVLFYLLRVAIPSKSHASQSVMAVMCNTLASNAADSITKNCIVDAILSLLTLSDEDNPNIPAGLVLTDVESIRDVNLGTRIVLTEIHPLLSFVHSSLPPLKEKKKINMKHLEIVNRLSEFVVDGALGEGLTSTLLTYIEAGVIRDDETLRAMLYTVSRLIATVKNPISLLPRMVSLQTTVGPKECRIALQNIFKALSASESIKGTDLGGLLRHLSDLDAWDSSKIDEPDHEKRHTAYIFFNKVLDKNEAVDPLILQMLSHNHYFNLTELNDIAIRDAASTGFRKLIEYTGCSSLSENEKTIILERHLIPLVIKGLRTETEAVHHEFVSALVSLIIAFPLHKQLCHLAQLRNADDTDLDFFENVAHIQLHRRQRAFRRLSDGLESGDIKLPSDVMFRFFLPLLQPYISDISSKTSALSDEALRLLTFVMSTASWKRYWPMLEYYLNRLQKGATNQKVNIRAIVALIEAFHFDVDADAEAIKEFLPKRERTADGSVTAEEQGKGTEIVEDADNPEEDEAQKAEATEIAKMSIRRKVFTHLLPRLKDCAVGKDVQVHRKAQAVKYYDEDEIIQRAPIALATVKLLQRMPLEIMDQHLHGVVLKLCDLLMSRSIHVRESARKTLISIVEALGTKYLPFVLREIKVNLLKGYQIHVMIYTTHALIFAMQETLSSGDLDSCIDGIVEVCKMDLFSDISEEKAVTEITKDVPEAKGNRTFDTYSMLGRFVSTQTIGLAVAPLKEVIESRPTAKTIKQVGQLLKHYSIGLTTNQGIDSQSMLAFAYRTVKDNIDEVLAAVKPQEQESFDCAPVRMQSCLLLDKEPTRVGVLTAKTSVKSRMFVFVEFGLQILASNLKMKKYDIGNTEDIARLDPFVPLIANCLELKYDKIVSNALRSFILMLKFPLPSLKSQIQAFVDRLYILLAEYAALGAAGNKGVVLELSQLLFKAFTQMVKDAPALVLTSKRLQLLLNYVETDVIDSQKQATAFSLIKAIIGRKLQDPKICDVVNHLCELAVVSGIPHIQVQCRQVIAQFVGNHPQSKKPKVYVDFFLNQLEYEHENGRVSAVEMLNMLFESLVEAANDQHSMVAMVKLATMLVNDDSAKCRRLAALAIRKLLSSISESKLNDIYVAVRDWLQSDKEINIKIAMLVFAEFSEVLGEQFSGKLLEILPSITKVIQEKKLAEHAESTTSSVLDSLTNILRRCPNGSKQAINDGLLDQILDGLGDYGKCAASIIIQFSTTNLLGQVFALADIAYCSKIASMSKEIVEWMCWQLKNRQLTPEIAEQVSKNVVYLYSAFTADDDLEWLCGRLCAVCKFEIVKLPKEMLRRSSVFKMVAVFILRTDGAQLLHLLDYFLPYLYREMNAKSQQAQEELQKLATEVGDIVKQKIGNDVYNKKLSECQRNEAKKSEMRKRQRKEEAIIDPVAAALKKQKRNLGKIAAKKRKLDAAKPYRAARRKKAFDV